MIVKRIREANIWLFEKISKIDKSQKNDQKERIELY